MVIGVSGLSDVEVYADLRELQHSLSPNETDSDSSVDSDDVLSSVYPVKPRKAIRLSRVEVPSSEKYSETMSAEVEEALEYVKKLSMTHKELLETDSQREEMEITVEVSVIESEFSDRLYIDSDDVCTYGE